MGDDASPREPWEDGAEEQPDVGEVENLDWVDYEPDDEGVKLEKCGGPDSDLIIFGKGIPNRLETLARRIKVVADRSIPGYIRALDQLHLQLIPGVEDRVYATLLDRYSSTRSGTILSRALIADAFNDDEICKILWALALANDAMVILMRARVRDGGE